MTSTAPHPFHAHGLAQPKGDAGQPVSEEHLTQADAPTTDDGSTGRGVDRRNARIEHGVTGDLMRDSVAALVRQDGHSHHAADRPRGPGAEIDPQSLAPGNVARGEVDQSAAMAPAPVPTLQALFTGAQMPDPKALLSQLLNTLCVSGHAITMAELRNETILLALDGYRFAFTMEAGNLPRPEDLYRPDLSFASLPAARLALALRNGTWRMMIEVEEATPDPAVQAATDAVFSLVAPQVVVWTPGQLALSAAEYATVSLSDLASLGRGPRLPHLRHRYERPAMTPGLERRSVFSGSRPKQGTGQADHAAAPGTANEDGAAPPRFPPVPTPRAPTGRSRHLPEHDGRVGPVSRTPESSTPPGTSSEQVRAPDMPGTGRRTAPEPRDNRFALGGALCDAFSIDTGANQPQLVTTMLVTASLGLKIGTLMLSAMGATTGTF